MSKRLFMPAQRLCLFIALACLLCGCGDASSTLFPVTGKVTINGKAVTSGWVNYRADKSKGNTLSVEPVGEINSKGEYTLETKGKPGAPAGAYKVIVTSGSNITMDNTSAKPPSGISTLYQNADTTPLNVEVSDKPAPGAYDLKVGR